MTQTKRFTGVAALALALTLTFGATACGDASTTSEATGDREARSADCPARFGCAKTPVSFQVRNDSDTTIEFYASEFFNVRDADRLSLTMTVPARSTSETKAVYLGDDGLESQSGYVRGGSRGSWAWEIRTASSRTFARVNLGANEEFEFNVFDIFEGWSEIGQPTPDWRSTYDPVVLLDASEQGKPSWQAVGSWQESWDEGRPTMSWTFSAPAP